jgi:hypothetical protein
MHCARAQRMTSRLRPSFSVAATLTALVAAASCVNGPFPTLPSDDGGDSSHEASDARATNDTRATNDATGHDAPRQAGPDVAQAMSGVSDAGQDSAPPDDLIDNRAPEQDGGSQADAAPEVAPPPSDFFVSPSGGAGVFTTITAAIAAANSSAAATRTIHVAAGTYSAQSGETFPLVFRGVALSGAGPTATIIQGAGIVPAMLAAKVDVDDRLTSGLVTSSLLIGDEVGTTTIEHLTVEPSPPGALVGSQGITCNRGVTRSAGPAATLNTIVDDVVVASFEVAVRVTASSLNGATSGCSLSLTRSTLESGSLGVAADGLMNADGTPQQRVAVHVGDGTSAGADTIHDFSIAVNAPDAFGGADVSIRDGVADASITFAQLSSSDQGVIAIASMEDAGAGLDVEHSDISGIDNVGILLQGPVQVSALSDNSIHAVSTMPVEDWVAYGLAVVATTSSPVVHGVRRNNFFANDVAVGILSATTPLADTLDFGTAQDSGLNVFRCNRSPVSRSDGAGQALMYGYGADIIVDVPLGPPTLAIPFEGTVWDQVPPTTTDIITLGPTVDATKATAASAPACPAGRSP